MSRLGVKFNKGVPVAGDNAMSYKLQKSKLIVKQVSAVECPPCPPAECATTLFRIRLKFQFETSTPVEWAGEFVSWDGTNVTLNFGGNPPVKSYQYPAGYVFPDEIFMTFSATIEGIFCNPPCNLNFSVCQESATGVNFTRWFLDGGSYGPQSILETSSVFVLSTSLGASSLPFLQFIKIKPLLTDGINQYQFPQMGILLSEAPP